MDPPIQITSSSGCGEKIKILFFSFPAGMEVIFSLNIYNITLDTFPDLDPDLTWAKFLDQNPNSMYSDLQHWRE